MASKLVVLGIPWDVDTEGLKQYMSKFGEIDDCIVMKERSSGRSRGFGYVTFSSADDAKTVLESEHVLGNRTLEVKVATPRDQASKGHRGIGFSTFQSSGFSTISRTMTEVSKELLDLPSKTCTRLESLLQGPDDSVPPKAQKNEEKNKNSPSQREKPPPPGFTTEAPKSQVLGKVKDFLGIMAKANAELELKAQGSSRADFDVEVLSGNEQEYIEMDLFLGVADLLTPEAVAAAEATLGSVQLPAASTSSSSCSDSDDDSDEDCSTVVHSKEPDADGGRPKVKPDDRPNKRPKIVVLNSTSTDEVASQNQNT